MSTPIPSVTPLAARAAVHLEQQARLAAETHLLNIRTLAEEAEEILARADRFEETVAWLEHLRRAEASLSEAVIGAANAGGLTPLLS